MSSADPFNVFARRKDARDPRTAPSRLADLCKDADGRVRLHALNHSATPQAARRDLLAAVGLDDDNVRFPLDLSELARAPDRGSQTLASWCSDPLVLHQLVDNDRLDPSVTAALADEQPLAQVRAHLAGRADLEPGVQLKLAHDDSRIVRKRLAQNGQLAPPAESVLATDPDVGVRRTVAANPALTRERRSMMMEDQDLQVRLAAAARALPDVEYLLFQLAQPNAWSRRRAVGALRRHESGPVRAALQAIANDPSQSVRWTLAHHTEDQGLLRTLVDAGGRAAELALDKLAEPPEPESLSIAGQIVLAGHAVLAPAAARQLAEHRQAAIRAALARSHHVSDDVHELLFRDHDERVREALAGNRTVSESRLAALSQDPSPSVRRAALANPVLQERRASTLNRRFHGVDPVLIEQASLDVLESPNCTSDVIREVWRTKRAGAGLPWSVADYLRLASDPRAPDDVLRWLGEFGPREARSVARRLHDNS